MKTFRKIIFFLVILICIAASVVGIVSWREQKEYLQTAEQVGRSILKACGILPDDTPKETISAGSFHYDEIPAWDGVTPSVEINDGIPYFTEEDREIPDGMIWYSNLDPLGRCGPVTVSVCSAIMPDEDRDDTEERLTITPSGYQQKQYPEELVEHGYLYNRCYLLGWQLGGDASSLNLIAGTSYLNIAGMLPYENEVARYARSHPSNHVLYRVTPIFAGQERNCRGVLMEAYSLEDDGRLQFCIFIYNEQPGIVIDHTDGKNYSIHGNKTDSAFSGEG